MLKKVRVAVKQETYGMQNPAYYAAIDQDFAFNAALEEKISPKPVNPIQSEQVTPSSPASFFEMVKWVTMIMIGVLALLS